MNLVLYKGNNYYNRKIIRANSDYEYTTKYGFWEVGAATLSAFIINDGIRTSHIINYDHESNGFGDYAVAYNNQGKIQSRWWVLNSTVIRNGQVKVELLRDVIADWYDDIIVSTAYIKKGNLTSTSNSAIFNNEAMTYNQIKKGETFIKDKTGSGWYVGYLSKDLGDKTVNIPGTPVNATGSYLTEADYPYYRYTPENPFIGDYTDITYIVYGYLYDTKSYAFGWDDNGEAKDPVLDGWGKGLVGGIPGRVETELPLKGYLIQGMGGGDNVYAVWDHTKGVDWRAASYSATGVHTGTQTANFYNAENGRIILVGGVPKRVVVKQTTYKAKIDPPNSSTFAALVKQKIVDNVDWLGTDPDYTTGTTTAIQFSATAYFVVLEDVDETAYSYTIPGHRRHTEGVPYDVFAIPAGAIYLNGGGKASSTYLSKKLAAAIITDLVSGEGATQLYDIQYLPYCPLDDEHLYHLGVDTSGLLDIDYSFISTETEWTIVVFASTNNFNKIIDKNPISVPTDPINFKIANETQFYRLCSPNYNGQFEFSATKNGGVSAWNITFSYKPFTPYIKVSPQFGRLYGADFGDARGLICGGDFSLPQTNDAWAQYELQNKNYQVMFDRQIQNMEVNNAAQRTSEIWNVVAGTVSGTATGAMAGGMTPLGGYGAAIGAVAGGTASLVGGLTDISLNEKLRQEAMSYARDQYGYNLQNIQALPYSLTKVGSQNADYKIWPFVEKYGSTIEEENALRSKLVWNGFTIERIGLINVYKRPLTDNELIGTFVQGKIIRLGGYTADNKIAEVINAELQTGVYFV